LDDSQTAISYLQDHELDVNNILIITRDFNIHDSNWDLLYPHHSTHANNLTIIADSFNLNLSTPLNPGPTRFANNGTNLNSVLNLMFINSQNLGFNNHHIIQDKHLLSDHAPLFVEIHIDPTTIHTVKRSIKNNSEEEIKFNSFIIYEFSVLNSDSLTSTEIMENFTNNISHIFNKAWTKFSKETKITKHSKEW